MRAGATAVERVDPALGVSRGVCPLCGWRGPLRDTSRDKQRVLLNLDRELHEQACKAPPCGTCNACVRGDEQLCEEWELAP